MHGATDVDVWVGFIHINTECLPSVPTPCSCADGKNEIIAASAQNIEFMAHNDVHDPLSFIGGQLEA